MNRYLKYLNFIIYPFIVAKYSFLNIHLVPKLDVCRLDIVIKNLQKEDFLEIFDSFFFLETLTGQRPVIKKFLSKHQLKKKTYFIVLSVSLRKQFLFDFVEYLSCFVFPLIVYNKTKIKSSLDKSGCFSFYFKDILFFLGFPEKIKFLKYKLKINFIFKNFIFSELNKMVVFNILHLLGFFNEVFTRKK